MEEKKGMRFWLKCIERRPGVHERLMPFARFEGTPEEGVSYQVGQMEFPRIMYEGKDSKAGHLLITAEFFTMNPEICLALIKTGGRLQFNAQEAIDLGILSYEALKEIGQAQVKNTKPGAAVPVPSKPETPLPDFDTMNKNELIEFASDNSIAINHRMSRDDIKAHIVAEVSKGRK